MTIKVMLLIIITLPCN